MSPKVTVRNAPGTRDFLPAEMILRRYVRDVIEESFQSFGFQPIETPALERLDVLTGKYGKEADRLIFKILKRGADLERSLKNGDLSDLALRYDLTVPLARVIAMHRGELTFPFKRYQIQPVWRAERQQKGRYREFVQCDADIVGASSVTADAEIIALTDDILQKLNIPGYRIHVNHRKLLETLTGHCGVTPDRFFDACLSVDKLDKIGWDGVEDELARKDFPVATVRKLRDVLQFAGVPSEILDRTASLEKVISDLRPLLDDMRQLFADLEAMGIPEKRLSFTLHLARGLDYYTGAIFETVLEEPKIGSVTGGGRYDDLIGIFSGQSVPATGTTIGIERIFDVIRELRLVGDFTETPIEVLVTLFSEETRCESLKIASELRRGGVATEVFLDGGKKLGKQFAYADKKRIPFVIICGPEEIAENKLTLKNLTNGEQRTILRDELLDFFKRGQKK
jgi:histidyl-tRNA synthetase